MFSPKMTLFIPVSHFLRHSDSRKIIPRSLHSSYFSTSKRTYPARSSIYPLVANRLVPPRFKSTVDRSPKLHQGRYIIDISTRVGASYLPFPATIPSKGYFALFSTTATSSRQPDRKAQTKMSKDGGHSGSPATQPPEIHNQIHFSMRQIPTVGYTLQNMAMSLAAVAASAASFFVTAFFVLPLAVFRTALTRVPSGMSTSTMDTKKVILIVGASRGIGFNVLKQYADDPNAVIVAASRSIGKSFYHGQYQRISQR